MKTSVSTNAAALSAVALVMGVMHYGLLPAVLFGTLFYLGGRRLEQLLPTGWGHRRWIAQGIATALLLSGLTAFGFASAHLLGPEGMAGLLLKVSTTLDQLRGAVPEGWREVIPEGIDPLKDVLAAQLKEHAATLTQLSVSGMHQVVHFLLAVIIAVMLGLSEDLKPKGAFSAPLFKHLQNYGQALARVFSAQFKVALLNGTATGIFLLGVLPVCGIKLPFAVVATLLTFVFGLIPVVGNLMSNTLNILLGLSVSPWVALSCLGFLVVSHKLEYLLCARFVGQGVGAKTWELLTAMVLLEAVYGPIGFAAAPVLYAWVKTELRARELV